MTRARFWFLVLFPLSCFYVFAYPVLRLSNWYLGGQGIGLLASIFVWLGSTAALYYSFQKPRLYVRYIVVHWMGASFILGTLTVIAEILRLLFDLDDRMLAQGVILGGVLCIAGAIAFSHHLSVKRHTVITRRITRPQRIAQISDVHIGSRKKGFMDRIVRKLNQLEPDFVVITGDLVDSSAVDIDALMAIADLRAPTYFSIGNHERYADLDKMMDMADRLGMRTLRQAISEEEHISFLGIDDADHRDQVRRHLPGLEWNRDKYTVLLYHRPVGWEDAIEHGVDLMLSGHTHNGQIFPFNWLVRQQFRYVRGMHRERHHRLYVSSGTGTWGPLMRLGSMNEISVFDIVPE